MKTLREDYPIETLESECTYYDNHGDISNFKEKVQYNTTRFFRKFSDNENELKICEQLKDSPQKNVVIIYNVTDNIIDMEMLDIDISKENSLVCIKKGIENLHKLNIVYIDLKLDNIGYSNKDKVFKIFDFDHSGIVSEYDTNKWLSPPQF
jgi:serine/threonine protein kinase